jgi:phosphoribosylanthranilate isomerase
MSVENVPEAYVGVSGVVSPDVQDRLIGIAEDCGLFEKRILALGVKAVHKTQYLDIENSYGADWYPVGEEDFVNNLYSKKDDPRTLAVAQMYFDNERVHDSAYRKAFMARVMTRGQNWLQAVQFDLLPWHEKESVLDVAEIAKKAGLKVLLQCHKPAMEELSYPGVAKRLGSFACYIDYLLFDSSHGTGTRLDTAALKPFLDSISQDDRFDHTGLAVAGGLDAQTIERDLPSLLESYPELSWDAEGRLHPTNSDNRRPLNMQITEAYLKASTDVLTNA